MMKQWAMCWMSRRGSVFAIALWVHATAMGTPPPVAKVQPVSDTYFGTTVVDNYRWLEDQGSAQSVAWMKGQADYTRAMLDSMPGRKPFSADMQRFLDAQPFTITDLHVAGANLFYRKRARGASQEVLYVRPLAGGAERALVDLNTLSKPGQHVSIDSYRPSRDGALVAVALSEGGSELGKAVFYDAATGRQLPDRLDLVAGLVGFSADSKTFYYIALEKAPDPKAPLEKYRRARTRAHMLGLAATGDTIVLVQGLTPDIEVPDYNFPQAFSAINAPYAVAMVYPGTDPNYSIYLGPPSALASHKGWRKVVALSDKVTDSYLRGNDLYVVSFAHAPNGKLLRVDARNPDLARAEVVVPPSDDVLTNGTTLGSEVLSPAADALYLRIVRNGYGASVRVPYGPHPKVTSLTLPSGMQVSRVVTDEDVAGAMVKLDSWTDPGDWYRATGPAASIVATGLIEKNDVDLADLVAKEVEVDAKDGTKVPLTIVYRRNTKLDGSAPAAMIGYGAYGDAWTPSYNRSGSAWLARGGVLAVAHVRGGGERGEAWHLAGYKLTKHNTWEDFIACGHYLVDHRYTSKSKLGIWSQSAGGILIGRAITTEPSLFAAAVDGVPLSDTLRFEKGANGPGNIPEFGSVATKEGFDGLYAMGAYYHIVAGTQYPATMVTAGAHDPRVDPWQGAKMAAALQASGSKRPILLRVNYDSGHFADTTAQTNADWTDVFTFFLWNFGDPAFQPAHGARATAAR